MKKAIEGTKEVWKKINNYPDYMISNKGRIISLNYNGQGKIHILNPSTNGRYVKVGLKNENGRKTLWLHRLVAESFSEKREGCEVVDHIDGDKTNNNAENLRWVTPAENSANPSTHSNCFIRYHKEGEFERRSAGQKRRFLLHPESHWRNKKKPPRVFS